MHVIRINKVDLVIVPAVAGMSKYIAASSGGGLQRARAEQPVAEIDDMDVLLDEDVARQGPIPEPIAEAVFVGAKRRRSFSFEAGAL